MLANQMFKVYFKINRHHLCKPLVRAIESCPLKDKFSLAQRITYKFYTGQRAMFDGDYKTADECLSYCFANCHNSSKKNKRSILIYLVPVKMILVSAKLQHPKGITGHTILFLWHVIKIGPKGALGSHEIRLIHSAPSLGQSIEQQVTAKKK